MNISFYEKVVNSSSHRRVRDELKDLVLNDKSLLPDLIEIAFDIDDKNHHRAAWILELVFEVDITWLKDHLPFFCDSLPTLKVDSTIRPISKICLFAVKHNIKNPTFLSEKEVQQIIESSFDWLIDPDRKVAPKAYGMRTLYVLGKNIDWIYPELQPILEQGFSQHSAAYKAATKNILREIERRKRKQG
ncbi:MAG: hypothetical protein BM557_03640 [Flavobacterium sp. MedPE-SWcel]|uniref:hypothetical protein n=1 Tax=uncultured Flavobacterium sp. TaxID=165435 RepID=UPI0009150568|nr:hypothetical protein [uncultured Flavobacterium sp.]OIQ21355.1 MAG: hypothetical protein BM557_03640 [Flavobacterium sp. MedPE-SWcel]